MKFTPKIIKTAYEHEAALTRIEKIFGARAGTPQGDELELLVHLVERYEEDHFPIDLPDPLAAIRFRMEQTGLKQKDLAEFLGSESKVSEVMSGRRDLSLTMIKKLVNGLGIPAEVFLQKSLPKYRTKTPRAWKNTRSKGANNRSAIGQQKATA